MMKNFKHKNVLLIVLALVIVAFGLCILLRYASDSKEPSVSEVDKEEASQVDFANPPALVDGRIYYPGIYHASSPVNGMKSYYSEYFGLSLKYPAEYILFENLTEGGPQERYNFVAGSIVMGLDLPVRQSIVRAEAGQGGGAPPGIALTFYLKSGEHLPLEEWLYSNPSGNFNAEVDPDAERSLTATTIAGVPALTYHSDFGMYPTDYAAFTYGKWFVLASAPNLDEGDHDMIPDFRKVLETLEIR